ncbi:glycoside hydrolase family 32 protein [Schlesneria sp. T3-172]|uniref:glycoside hydrolase family 32 protein n=1 Tax=Schlesneria sphaerica TaxID=3373610 RepID=UPI0037C55494
MLRIDCARGWLIAAALVGLWGSCVFADEPQKNAAPADDFALNLHLIHPGADSSPGDPNAAFCLDGTYHLHYILRHPYKDRESVSFVHLTSSDMLHWNWETTKLQPAFTGHGMFSGTGFLTKEGKPAAIYHGHLSGRNQIAIAKDRRLSEWEKPYAVQVTNPDGSEAKIEHWDPDCFLIGETYYAISGGTNPPLMKSTDLKHWTLVGDFLAHELPDVAIGEDISCPNFFPIGDKWMLLCISHTLGCRYYIGDWDAKAEKFVPQTHGRLNFRRDDQPVYGLFQRTDFFAPESVLTPDGRRVMWAWLTSIGEDNKYLNKTIQSLPRELSLASDRTLRIKPLKELATLRDAHQELRNVELSNAINGPFDRVPPIAAPELQTLIKHPGDTFEVRIVIPRAEVERKLFGFVLFSDGKDGGLPILFRPETGTIRVGTTDAPFKPADLDPNEDVELRIFVDRYLVEVFVNDRQSLVAVHEVQDPNAQIAGFTTGATTRLKSIETWTLKPTNQGYLKAKESKLWEPNRQAND